METEQKLVNRFIEYSFHSNPSLTCQLIYNNFYCKHIGKDCNFIRRNVGILDDVVLKCNLCGADGFKSTTYNGIYTLCDFCIKNKFGCFECSKCKRNTATLANDNGICCAIRNDYMDNSVPLIKNMDSVVPF